MMKAKNCILLSFLFIFKIISGVSASAGTTVCSEEFPFWSGDWYGGGLSSNPSGLCSGQGECINGTCICESGWTGRSDFINTEGIDCQINELTIQLEWGLIVTWATVSLVLTRNKIRSKIQEYQETKQRRSAQGKQYSLWRNNPVLLAMALYDLGTYPSMVLLGLLRIFKEDERAGLTAGYTLFFFTGKLSFYTATVIFQPALLGSLLKSSKNNSNRKAVEKLVRLGWISSYFTFVLSVLAGATPLIIYFSDQKGVTNLAQGVYFVYFLLQFTSMVVYCVFSAVIRQKANSAFLKSYELTQDERTKMLQEKLNQLELRAIIFSTIIGLIYLSCLLFPFLWNKHDYLFPLTWIPFILLGKEINSQYIEEKTSKADGTGSSKELGNSKSKYSKGQPLDASKQQENDSSKQLGLQSSDDDDDGFV